MGRVGDVALWVCGFNQVVRFKESRTSEFVIDRHYCFWCGYKTKRVTSDQTLPNDRQVRKVGASVLVVFW